MANALVESARISSNQSGNSEIAAALRKTTDKMDTLTEVFTLFLKSQMNSKEA
jgi:hypothetical protein